MGHDQKQNYQADDDEIFRGCKDLYEPKQQFFISKWDMQTKTFQRSRMFQKTSMKITP